MEFPDGTHDEEVDAQIKLTSGVSFKTEDLPRSADQSSKNSSSFQQYKLQASPSIQTGPSLSKPDLKKESPSGHQPQFLSLDRLITDNFSILTQNYEGRDKILKMFQYLSKFMSWYVVANNKDQHNFDMAEQYL